MTKDTQEIMVMVKVLREKGVTYQSIGDTLGVTRACVGMWINHPEQFKRLSKAYIKPLRALLKKVHNT